MSEAENLTNLQEVREAKETHDLMEQFDAAALADGIRPDGYLGRYHALVSQALARTMTGISDDRAARRTFIEEMNVRFGGVEQRILEMVDDGRDFITQTKAVVKDELAKLDRAARVQEAQFKRQELGLEKSAKELIGRLSADLCASLKEGNIIRSNAYNRRMRLKDFSSGIVAGVALCVVLVIAGITIDRTLLYHNAPLATYQDGE